MMKQYLGPFVLGLIAVLMVSLAGCPGRVPEEGPGVGGAQVPALQPPAVTLTAYINVSSGCQQPTVDFIKELESKHEGRLAVEFIDFGDQGAGNRAWKEAGLDCMALQIDGASTVAWGEGEERRTVSFNYPVGFTWTHEDLAAAIEVALGGELGPGDPEEAQALGLLQAKVTAQSVKVADTGVETGQFLINDKVVIEVTQSRGDLIPAQRVTAAAKALTEVLEQPFKPSSLSVEQVEEGWALMAGEAVLLIATEADAEAAHIEPVGRASSPTQLAEQWSLALREALAKAAFPGRTTDQGHPTSD